MKADAIVLPSNKYLKEGSGTSKAIFEKAGRAQLEWDDDLLEIPRHDSLPILSPVRTLSPALTDGAA